MGPTLAVIIPCYNAERTIELCINSVLNQTFKPNEIIIVDDGSKDLTYNHAIRFGLEVTRHDVNRGIAAARNTGIGLASCEIVSFLDSDCVASRRWLENIVKDFELSDIVGVGGRGIETRRGNVVDRHRAIHASQTHGLDKKYVIMLHGLCFSFRKEALVAIGGFNEYFKTNGEDMDVCLRLHRKGLQLLYDPDVLVYHLRGDDLRSYLKATFRAYKYGYYAQLLNLGYTRRTIGMETSKIYIRFLGKTRYDLRQSINLNIISSIVLSFLVALTQNLALYAVYREIRKARYGKS